MKRNVSLTDVWYHHNNQEDDSEKVIDECKKPRSDALSNWIGGLYSQLIKQGNGTTDKKSA